MSRYKELLKNIGVLTVSNFGSKLLAFFLVPLYTAVLSTEDYGYYDIIYTTITILSPLLTINITEGAMRFLLDKNTDKENICKKSIAITNTSIIIIALIAALNCMFHLVPIFEQYSFYSVLFYAAFTYCISTQNIARGLNQIRDVGISGFLNSFFLLALNMVFLVVLKMGLNGYFLAGIISNSIAAFYLAIKCKLIRYIKNIGYRSGTREKELVAYSKPLMLNSISWWINDVSDRYIVTYICGAAINGIYSVAYKIPTILSLFHSIFNQAWLISITKEYKQRKNIKYVQDTYKIYNLILIVGCSALIVSNKVLASVLYQGDFYIAWEYVPFLLISAVFAAIGSAIGVIFGAEKDSKISARTTVVGALLNIVLNFILINHIGAIGAAIATAASSFTVWIVRLSYCKRYIHINVSVSDIMSYIILVIQAILFMVLNRDILFCVEALLFILILIVNFSYISKIMLKTVKKGVK